MYFSIDSIYNETKNHVPYLEERLVAERAERPAAKPGALIEIVYVQDELREDETQSLAVS